MSGRAGRDRRIVQGIAAWFAASARPLPWRAPLRGPGRDPYRSLVSEFMLQQTQVSRVIERFAAFVERFPTVSALAAASEHDVLALWSGLGYYRRARNLHAAAREVASRLGGRIPVTVEELRTLPGVGRYTAGAIASIVFGRPEPIVDGNVARVLLRIDGQDLPTERGIQWAWTRAAELVAACDADEIPAFNEGLMELGALVCTPRSPRCDACPARAVCIARAKGLTGVIPRPKRLAARRTIHCASVLITDVRGRVLVERRGPAGLWAGLWQAPTLESPARATRAAVERWIGLPGLARLNRLTHSTTHRIVEFEVWRGEGPVSLPGAMWKSPAQIRRLPLSSVQSRILLELAPPNRIARTAASP